MRQLAVQIESLTTSNDSRKTISRAMESDDVRATW